jgi:hypothetical protein
MNHVVHAYSDNEEQLEPLKERVDALIRVGFRPEQITDVSVRGLNHALCIGCDDVGGYRLQRFSGEYSDDGDAILVEGAIQAESLYRFKCQQAPAVVILTNVDFDGSSPEREEKLLYRGLARPQID